MKEKSRQKRLRLLAEAKKKPAVFTVYIVLRSDRRCDPRFFDPAGRI